MPMMGVDSGAMIIAPITVAVESASTPLVAMTPDRTSIVQKADRLEALSPLVRSRSSVQLVEGTSLCQRQHPVPQGV